MGASPRMIRHRGVEGAITVAQQHDQIIVGDIAGYQINFAVAVEITRRNHKGPTCRKICRRCEFNSLGDSGLSASNRYKPEQDTKRITSRHFRCGFDEYWAVVLCDFHSAPPELAGVPAFK